MMISYDHLKTAKPTPTKFKVGMECLIHGLRWVIIDELIDDQTAWAVDQEGEEFEIEIGQVDHFYPFSA